jgi:hypothetical protein
MLTFATPFCYIELGSGIRDLRSGMNKYSDPGSGIKHPGSATLLSSLDVSSSEGSGFARKFVEPHHIGGSGAL